MKKIILFLISIIISSLGLMGQKTFYKEMPSPLSFKHSPVDLSIHEGNIVLLTESIGQDTLIASQLFFTGRLTVLNKSGTILQELPLPAVSVIFQDQLHIRNDSFFIIGGEVGVDNDDSKHTIVKGSFNSEQMKKDHAYLDHRYNINQYGSLMVNNTLFTYGHRWARDIDSSFGYVAKWNKNKDSIVSSYLLTLNSGNATAIKEADQTPDDNIILIQANNETGPNNDTNYVVKLDTNLNEVWKKKRSFNDEAQLLVHSNGNIIVMDRGIRCYDAEFENLLWEKIFNVINGGSVINSTFQLKEDSKGNILGVGQGARFYTSINRYDPLYGEYAGITFSLSSEGELNWWRSYILPDTIRPEEEHTLLWLFAVTENSDKNGYYIAGRVNRFYTQNEAALLLSVDENGCIDGLKCGSEIVLSPTGQRDSMYLPLFYEGKQWILKDENGNKETLEVKPGNNIYKDTVYLSFSDRNFPTGEYIYRDHKGRVYRRKVPDDLGATIYPPEELIYDFNLEVGDTFWLPDIGMGAEYLVVDSVDSYFYPDLIERKRMYMRCPNLELGEYWDVWIEGIGGLYNTFTPEYRCAFDVGTELLCHFSEGIMIYGEGDCAVSTEDPNTESSIKRINLYPNPVKGVLYIDSKTQMDQVWIYDVTGKEVLSFEKIQGQEIFVGDLKRGVYFLVAKDETGIPYRNKFIKQ